MIAHNLSCRAKSGSAIKTPTIKPSQQTYLISTNWSISSNAQLSSRPLDFVMMHLMHKGGITTIVSCCRDMFMYRTYLNRNNDTETMGEAQDQLQGHNFNQSSAHI
jgi:hypothetical protein